MLNEIDSLMFAWATNAFGVIQTDENGRPTPAGLDWEQRKAYQHRQLHLMRQIDMAAQRVDR